MQQGIPCSIQMATRKPFTLPSLKKWEFHNYSREAMVNRNKKKLSTIVGQESGHRGTAVGRWGRGTGSGGRKGLFLKVTRVNK